jgi:hypothetical protein
MDLINLRHDPPAKMKIHRQTEYGIHTLTDNGPARSSGVHISGIIRQIAVKHGILESVDQSADNIPTRMRWNVGFAWEYYCASHIPNLIHQPGQVTLDGIAMSPDGITPTDTALDLHEFKATWTSSAKPIQERYMWLWQCMGYLAGLSAHYNCQCTRAFIHPLYLNGDYRANRHPIYEPVLLEFEWAEIMKNWELMLAYKEYAKPEVYGE